MTQQEVRKLKKQLKELNETVEQLLFDYKEIYKEAKQNISILQAIKSEIKDCLVDPDKYYENIVYIWKDLSNNYYYIGSTGNEDARIKAHKTSYDTVFHRRLAEHPEEFEYTVVSRHPTRKAAYEAETKLIKEYDRNGYKLYNIIK